MTKSVSLVINHSPWRPERVAALATMMRVLQPLKAGPVAFFVNDRDYRGRDWQEAKVEWAIEQWRWSLKTPATHHVFMTDDLEISPDFWEDLRAMVEACPDRPIGLLSNHPSAPDLALEGWRWYRTNSWLVGPCYLMPHEMLHAFVTWFESLPDGNEPGCKGWANDDSSINEWITKHGPGECLHPLPTIISHDPNVPSTVGHGDEFSRERINWRSNRWVGRLEGTWLDNPSFWMQRGGPSAAPMLTLPTKGE